MAKVEAIGFRAGLEKPGYGIPGRRTMKSKQDYSLAMASAEAKAE